MAEKARFSVAEHVIAPTFDNFVALGHRVWELFFGSSGSPAQTASRKTHN